MDRTPTHTRRPRRRVPYRPLVERLEERLPPGDAVFAGLLAQTWLAPDLAPPADDLTSAAPAHRIAGAPATVAHDGWLAWNPSPVPEVGSRAEHVRHVGTLAAVDATEPFARPAPVLRREVAPPAQPELLAAVAASVTFPPAALPPAAAPGAGLYETPAEGGRLQALAGQVPTRGAVDPRAELLRRGELGGGRGPSQCPVDPSIPDGTTCFAGQDKNGAYYLIAIPPNWTGGLVLYAHGGPVFTPPQPLGAAGLGPRIVLLPQGVAVAGTTYRAAGYHISQDAEDVENLRQIFVQQVGKPRWTVITGASYGGPVGAKVVELYAVNPDGTFNYDGAVLNLGVMAGYRRYTYMRLDLRVVYQHYCHNNPYPDEPQYPLWQGLPPGTSMTVEELNRRVNECTEVEHPEKRTEQQQRNLTNILNVTHIPEDFLLSQMDPSTRSLQDLSLRHLNGRNAFPNRDVWYTGSDDDVALNRGLTSEGLRYYSDQGAAAFLTEDSEPTGVIDIPVLTAHGIGDGRAFVENEAAYREAVAAAGREHLLFQVYYDRAAHTPGDQVEYAAYFDALFNWIETGKKPTQEGVMARCAEYQKVFTGDCRFDPKYEPAPLESRIHPRRP